MPVDRPPTPLEAAILQELSLLTKSLLYQQELDPAAPAGKSKAHAEAAWTKGLCAASHPDPAARLNLWTHALGDLIDAEFQALYARCQHFEEVQQADPEGWNWKRLEERIADARLMATMAYHYWRGWQEALGQPVPENPLSPEHPPLPANMPSAEEIKISLPKQTGETFPEP